MPIGDDNSLVAYTTGDEPYVPLGHDINTGVEVATIKQDFKLKRGIWAEGRAYDVTDKQPRTGEVEYFIFRNAELERELRSLKVSYLVERYHTDAEGKFRVPVLHTRGILTFRYSDLDGGNMDSYPRGVGADKIAGATDNGQIFETLPHYLLTMNHSMLIEISPKVDDERVTVDFALSHGRTIYVDVVDDQGQPISSGLEYCGQTDFSGWDRSNGATCEIKGLQPGESREVRFFCRPRNLVGSIVVDEKTEDRVRVTLTTGGAIRCRLVDEDGEPITDAILSANWPPHPELMASNTQIPVDKEGRFHIEGLIPGKNYTASVSAPRKLNGLMQSMILGSVLQDAVVEAGKTVDVGDVTPTSPKPKAKKKKRSAEQPAKTPKPQTETK